MDSSEIIKQIEQTILQENERVIYYYQVYFKCSTDIYSSLDKREHGDMVIVHCDRGYNVGFIDNEVSLEDFYSKHPDRNQRPKKILSFLADDDQTIRKMLISKIAAENYALNQCKTHIKGRKLSIFADTIATEFQFDRKKLTIYIKKYDDVSVCRLVRKLYEAFKMRIKVLEVDSANTLHDIAWKYLEVSKLNIPFDEIFTFDLNSSTVPFLNTFSQPITESNLNQNTPNSNIYSNLFKTYLKSQESSPSLSSSPPPSPSLSSLSDDIKPIPILEHNSPYPNNQIYHVPEVIRQTPQIISNIHTGLPLSSSSPSSITTTTTILNQYNHDELYHYQKNNYHNNDNHNQRHSAPAGLTHYQLQQLPRDPAPRSKSFSSSNIEQSSSTSFKRSIHHRPIVWSSSMNENKVENRSLPQYNISAQPFYPDSHRYNPNHYSHNNDLHENNSYSYHHHQNQHQHHSIKNINMNNNHFNNESNHLLKHQSYHFQPSQHHQHHHHYQQSHEFNNSKFMMNEQYDHSSSPLYSKDFYQSSSSDSHDTDDLLSQVTDRVKLLTTNSTNYPHYVFEPSQPSSSSTLSSSSSSFFPSSQSILFHLFHFL